MAPHPGSEEDYIREKARKDLLHLLETVQGKKNLVISKDLAGPVSLCVEFSVLREYGVDRIFLLENANVDSSHRNVIFLVHAEKVHQVTTVGEQIKRLQQNGNVEHDFSIFWVPRRTLVSNKILEEAGVIGDVNVFEFPLYFLPLDQDLLSLELEDSFSDLFLHKDPSSIYLAAKALMNIQHRHGYFPRIVGKGDNAKRLADLLLRMRKEVEAEQSSDAINGFSKETLPSASIDNLVIIDREVDFASPMLTQLTYEGLIDEFVGIKNNHADVDISIVGVAPIATQGASSTPSHSAATPPGMKRKIQLDSSDTLFKHLRDANFAIVGDILNRVARRLENDYESRHQARTTSELREFVNKLPGYQQEHHSLKIHTNLAEEIVRQTRTDIFRKFLEVQQNNAAGLDSSGYHEIIEELISRDVPIKSVLRLLCLESCMSGGLRSKDLDNFKRQILQAYGYQHLATFRSLEKMELLQPRSSAAAMLIPGATAVGGTGTKTNYSYLRKHLRLVIEEVSEKDPNDISYVYSGFAPLSVRLVQCVLQKPYMASLIKGGGPVAAGSVPPSAYAASSASPGWLGFEDIVKSARGSTFNIVQKGDDKTTRARQTLSGGGGVKTTYVFFLGGITFAEIAALRFIARQEESRRKIIICTTCIINGDRMIDVALEKRTFRSPTSVSSPPS